MSRIEYSEAKIHRRHVVKSETVGGAVVQSVCIAVQFSVVLVASSCQVLVNCSYGAR